MIDYLSIDESEEKFNLDNMDPESEAWIGLFQKHLERYKNRSLFWAPRLAIAKKCSQYMRRDIFTPEQRRRYIEQEDKFPIEPQEMKPVLRTLEKLVLDAVPGTSIDFEDDTPPDSAIKPEGMKFVISKVKHLCGVHQKRKQAVGKGLEVGFPICLWADKVRDAVVVPGMIPLSFSVLPWDSALPKEWYSDPHGADIDDVILVKGMVTRDELFRTFPNRKKAFTAFEKLHGQSKQYMERLAITDTSKTSKDRSNYIYDMVSQARFNSEGGRFFLIQSVFPIVKKRRAWYNTETLDVVIPPPDWDEARLEEWKQLNPGFDVSDEVDIKTLWVTTISSDGFIWENREHWYQEDGELPGAWFIPDEVDGLPCGAGEDMLPYAMMVAVAETEGLSEVRKGTGTVTYVTEGAVKNVSKMYRELSSPQGVVLLKKNHTPRDSVQVEKRTPNTTYLDLADRTREKSEAVHRINSAAMGGTVNRQSEAAKKAQIAQTMAPQTHYVDSCQQFFLRIEDLICKLIPRTITEGMLIEMRDEFGEKQGEMEVNQTEFDQITGEARIIANDLTSARYRVQPMIADDSKTSRDQQMQEFNGILAAVGNQIFKLDPRMLGAVLNVFPNRFAKEAAKYIVENGERLQQQQQQMAEAEQQADREKQDRREKVEFAKMRTPKVAYKFSPQDIKESPVGAKVLFTAMQEAAAINEIEPMEQEMTEQPQQGAGNEGEAEMAPQAPTGQI